MKRNAVANDLTCQSIQPPATNGGILLLLDQDSEQEGACELQETNTDRTDFFGLSLPGARHGETVTDAATTGPIDAAPIVEDQITTRRAESSDASPTRPTVGRGRARRAGARAGGAAAASPRGQRRRRERGGVPCVVLKR